MFQGAEKQHLLSGAIRLRITFIHFKFVKITQNDCAFLIFSRLIKHTKQIRNTRIGLVKIFFFPYFIS